MKQMLHQKLGFLGAIVLLFLCPVAGHAQGNATNPVVSSSTNQPVLGPPAPVGPEKVLLTFGLDQVAGLQQRLFGIPLWQYLAFLIYIVLAFYIAKLLDFITQVKLKAWAAMTETKLDDLFLELIHGPIKVVTFVIFLHIGLQVFQWPAAVGQWLSRGLQIIVGISLTYMVLKFIDMSIGYWRQRAGMRDDKVYHDQLFPIISKTLKAIVIVSAALVVCDNLGLKITSLLAGISIGGLAVGLAAQDTVANLFGAVAVFVDKPFRIGDYVKLGDVEGSVEAIGLRSTRLRNPDGHVITVPNKTMGNSTITNVTRRTNIKTTMNIGVTYDTPTEKVKAALAILDDVYRSHPMTEDLVVSFNKFADFALNFQVIHWWKATDYKTYMAGMQELNLAIKEKFDSAGIQFAFPTQTLYVKGDPEWAAAPAAPVPRR